MNGMERPAIDGESPVVDIGADPSRYPSTAGHVQSGGNPRGPSRKAKYYWLTDSEQVPRGKEYLKPYVYKQWERYAARKARPRTFCIMGLRVTVGGKVKPQGGAAAKA